MEIRTISVSRLNPAEYNPRVKLEPGSAQYEQLARSLDEFGYVAPIIWNEDTGNIVGGHQRLAILAAQGMDEVEVSVVHLDEIKEKALNLALNKISGEWDDEKLSELLIELSGESMIDLTGFSTGEVDLLTMPDSIFACADDVDLSAEYKEPEKKQLKCPKCSHVDTADRFTKR